MADASVFQSSFLGGEWSPLAQGRADSPDYRRALATCLNAIPTAEGAWTRRGGFLACGATHGGWQGIIRPFLFPNNTPGYLEFAYNGGGSTLHCWVPNAAKTAFVRQTIDTRTISAISNATPAQVTVTASETWSTGDDVVFSLATATAVGPSYALQQQREFVITRVDGTHFTIADAVTGTSVNGTALSYSSSGSDTVSKVLAFSLPYTTLAAVQAIRVVKADNLAIILSPGYAPITLYWNGSAFTLTSPANLAVLDGPYLDPLIGAGLGQLGVSTGHINANWLTGPPTQFIINDGSYSFTSNDVGKLLRLWNQPPAWNIAFDYATAQFVPGTVPFFVTYNGGYWRINDFGDGFNKMPIGTAPGTTWSSTRNNITQTRIGWIPAVGVANWIIAQITSIVSGTTAAVTFLSQIVSYPSDGSNTTCDMWQLGLFGLGGSGGYPTGGAYRQGRLYLGGAQPNRADLSFANALDPWKVQAAGGILPTDAFSPTDLQNNVGDADAIAAVMNDAELNSIFAFTPVKAGMVALTPGGEFLIDSSTLNDGLTPSTTKADKVSQYKAANVEPLRIGAVNIFVQAAGREVLEYFADAFTGQPIARPINEFSKHMTASGIAEIRYQHERVPIIWARPNNNSILAGCTYRRLTTFASQPPEFAAWHQHTHGSGTIESICTGPTPDGLSDCVMAIVNTNGVRYVEMMTPIFDDEAALPAAMHVDGAFVVSGTDSNTTTLTIYGLDRYAGLNVDVWLGALDCGTLTVSASGTVSVPYGSDTGGLLTRAYLTALNGQGAPYQAAFDLGSGPTRVTVPCVIGFSYMSQGLTLRAIGENATKTPTGEALGMTIRGHMYAAYLTNTVGQGIVFGGDAMSFFAVKLTSSLRSPTLLTTAQMFTGVWQETLDDDYDFDGQLIWQITRPYPATIGAVTLFADTQER